MCLKGMTNLKISKSQFYRNEMDISYNPSLFLRLGVMLNMRHFLPPNFRNIIGPLLSSKTNQIIITRGRRNFPFDDLADKYDPSIDEKRDFWGKDFGVIITHDVDSVYGLKVGLPAFIQIEKKFDLVSTFNLFQKQKTT